MAERWLQWASIFPQPDGSFNFGSAEIAPYTNLVIEVPTISSTMAWSTLPCRISSATLSSTLQTPFPSHPPSFHSVIATRKVPSFSLKVVKASMTWGRNKPNLQSISQTYTEICEGTANLKHILSIVQRRWGSEYILVMADGLPLEDLPATQGL